MDFGKFYGLNTKEKIYFDSRMTTMRISKFLGSNGHELHEATGIKETPNFGSRGYNLYHVNYDIPDDHWWDDDITQVCFYKRGVFMTILWVRAWYKDEDDGWCAGCGPGDVFQGANSLAIASAAV